MGRTASKQIKGHNHGRVPRAFREEQLLDVAQGLFARQGYQGTAIEDIAAAAGVTRPMIYNYFKSKDGIYLACLRRARAALDTRLTEAVSKASTPEQRFAAGSRAYFEFVATGGPAWEVLFGGGAAIAGAAASEARKLRFATVEGIAALIKASAAPGINDLALAAYANLISGGSEQLAKWWRENPRVKLEQILEFNHSMFWPRLAQLLPK